MQERQPDDMRERGAEAAQNGRDRAEEMADQSRAAVQERMEQGREQVEQRREQGAEAMDSAAEQLRQRAGGDGAVGTAGEKAAEGMERTAQYMRERDTAAMRDDLEAYVRDHPGQALGAAVVAGFFIGRILR